MIDKKKLPDWIKETPNREKALIIAILQEYVERSTIDLTAYALNITPYLCYEYTNKLCQCGLLDIGPDGYKLKPEYIKEVDHE